MSIDAVYDRLGGATPAWKPLTWFQRNISRINANWWPCTRCTEQGLTVTMKVIARATHSTNGWHLNSDAADLCQCPRCGGKEIIRWDNDYY